MYKNNKFLPIMVELKESHWEAVQAKTFTKWFNDKLNKGGFPLISDLYKDLHDGVALGNLLKCLCSNNVSYNKKPFTRIQKVENLEILLKYIKKQGLSLINIGPEDIVDCNKKLILGLIWTLISKLSISDLGVGDMSVKDELLRWCKEVTREYKNVNILDLSRSWQDGLGFNAIIHKFRPDLIPNYHELKSDDRHFNLEQAFDVAERNLQIPKLLDVEDVADVVRPDEKIMITYLSEYYKKFFEHEKDQICKNILSSLLNKIEWSLQSRNFYEIKARSFLMKQKLYFEKKKEFEELVKKINILQDDLQDINNTLSSDYLSLTSTLEEINMLHGFYNIKEYVPPQDITIDKIDYHYEDLSFYLAKNLRIKAVENVEDKINQEIFKIKSSITKDNKIQKKMTLIEDLIKTEVRFINNNMNENYKLIKDVIIQFSEFLHFLNNETVVKENTLKKAIDFFDNLGSEITSKEFKALVYKLGIYIDEEFVCSDVMKRDEFINHLHLLLVKSYDSVIIKKALNTLEKETELNEKEHKNLLCYNGKDKNISLTKLVNDFLK